VEKYQGLVIGLLGLFFYFAQDDKNGGLLFLSLVILGCWLVQFFQHVRRRTTACSGRKERAADASR
jgi:hypothetical protein